MKAYINHINAISRYQYLEGSIIEQNEVMEPDYESILDVRAMRRLSKILKMGLFTALSVKNQANRQPDGIICGTALGCLADTYQFLKNMSDRDEQLLTPTAFIQSTHNTLSGTLGIMLQNHSYNITWSNREFSFYDALEDAIIRVNKCTDDHILLTAADEMPRQVAEIIDSIPLDCPVPINSEGAASFWISSRPAGISITIESILTVQTSDVIKIVAETSEKTIVINSNPFLSFTQTDRVHNLVNAHRSLIDDAFCLHVGCQLLSLCREKSNPKQEVLCIGGMMHSLLW